MIQGALVASRGVVPAFVSEEAMAGLMGIEGGESSYVEAGHVETFAIDSYPESILLAPIGPFGCGGSGGAGKSGGVPPSGSSGGNGNGKGGVKMVKIGDLMETSGVGFGTSGARGLADKMTDEICYAYTKGFLQYLVRKGEIEEGNRVVVAGDLRPSTDRIMTANARAAADMGFDVVNGGKVPSPTAAYYGIVNKIPAIMVTGSHIPADRNGIKFNKVAGEILKSDEKPIKDQVVEIPTDLFDENGFFVEGAAGQLSDVNKEVEELFVKRVVDFFGSGALTGKRIGLYQHSAVGRDMFERMLNALGADVTVLGRSDEFIPVDTEAIRPEDVELAAKWAEEFKFDAIVSTDGDSDRPLLAGRDGKWLRGDVLGILAAKFMGADSVSAPVSCNTALEKSGFFKNVRRTKIGSPYVIASMNEAMKGDSEKVVSYEANGGFLTATDFWMDGKTLKALPTRDAFLPIIAAIKLVDMEEKRGVEELVADLPQRFTASDRLKEFPQEKSRAILDMFGSGEPFAVAAKLEKHFGDVFGKVAMIDRTDGVRVTFENGEVVHMRPSGNAPEFRVYTEAATEQRAQEINEIALGIVKGLV